ncbi:MutS protein msh4, partial [Physocladia obscura]
LSDLIDTHINADVSFQKNPQGMRNQRCYAIKAGWNGLLDVARQTYRESTNDVYELVSQYSDLDPSVNLPTEFINVVQTKKQTSFTTLVLLGLNERIAESLTEVYLMSDRIISELVCEIAKFAGPLYKISESIAVLDMVTAFAHDAEMKEYVRPEFTQTYAVKAGRHPVKDSISDITGSNFIPNDVYCTEGSNMQIISGPNMSGKTTYLKMIVLLNIMAQMGSFVPAEYASFKMQSQVFSRIGCDSVVEASASSFMSEMREAAFILQNVSHDSLIIIDELGRGTSHTDGVAMSIAITEQLAATKAFTFIATHFSELGTVLSSQCSNIVKLHLHVDCIERGDTINISYKYQVQDGTTNFQDYGLSIAKIANFPPKTVSVALAVSRKLEEKECEEGQDEGRGGGDREEGVLLKAQTKVYHQLVQTWLNSRLGEKDLRVYLEGLQAEIM